MTIPGGIDGLEAFRRWARSDDYPSVGRFAYLGGVLYADPGMEQLFTHNRIKTRVTTVVETLTAAAEAGYVFSDRTLLSNPDADLCTEPDLTFVSYNTIRAGRVTLTPGSHEGFVELVGSPDLVVEVVSPSSVEKDTVTLRELYARAGVPEYWVIDARGDGVSFDLLRLQGGRYSAGSPTVRVPGLRGGRYAKTRPDSEGWVRSPALGRAFRLTRETDALGHPQFTLAERA